MSNEMRGKAFEDALSDPASKALGVYLYAPRAKARGEGALDRRVIALAMPAFINQTLVDLLSRNPGIAMEISAKIAFVVAWGPSSVVFIMCNAYVIIEAETLPRVIKEVFITLHGHRAQTNHLVVAGPLTGEPRNVERPQVQQGLMEA